MNSKILYGKYFYVLIIGVITLVFTSNAFAGSNRKSVMDTREDGWTVAWGKHIDHIEYAKLSVCMLDPTTACINAYFTDLIKDSAKTLGKNIVLKALKNRGKLFSSGSREFGAGIATYNHWGRENPCSITGGTCWTPKIPKPNTHQPFVRWRTKSSSSSSSGSVVWSGAINAVVDWGNGYAYLFKGSQYTKYDINKDRTVNGYPASIKNGWSGVWSSGIDAAVNWENGYAYFFKGGQYTKFDIKNDRTVSGYPASIKNGWPGVWSSGIDAAVNWGNGYAYFFKGGQYTKFDIKNDRTVSGYPASIKNGWPGVWSNGIDAVVNWGNGYAYFFKGSQYIKYDIKNDKAVSGYPLPISGNWH